MGALIFYCVVYFIGYHAAWLLGRLDRRSLARQRRSGGIALVGCVALGHAYMILSAPLPHGQDAGPGSALAWYVILPVVVIVAMVLYLDRQEENDTDSSSS